MNPKPLVALNHFTVPVATSQPGTSLPNPQERTGISTYSDALAALVPAEILTIHALVVTAVTTKTDQGAKITDMETLWWAFYGMCILSVFIYVIPRKFGGRWDRLDLVRMLIPLFAFVGWTMLQPTSAFDAIVPLFSIAQRTIVAIFLAVILGVAATLLAYSADAKPK
jgi:hypothetical protein